MSAQGKTAMSMIKNAAAMRYRELHIKPHTAAYVFNRFTAKQAKLADTAPKLDPKIAKLVTGLLSVVKASKGADKSTV